MNNRRTFLKSTGLLGLTSLVPFKQVFAQPEEPVNTKASCTLIPTETAGPFPLDLTENSTFFRQDIKESKTGVPLQVKLKIIGADNCAAMPNLRVNIWHCDKDGLYSGYDVANNAGQAGLTYLRGYQITDANGEVTFNTIFPGWYNGRICHIHFQVYVSSSYAAISQLTFDVTTKNSIYTNNSSLYTKGTDPMSLSNDNIFSDGYSYQMATLTPNSTTGGYDAYLEVTINGSGTVGLGHIEKESEKQFTLQQNYPNPYESETTIPFILKQAGEVTLELWDFNGKRIYRSGSKSFVSGTHHTSLQLSALGIKPGNYVYQLIVKNDHGVFVQNKVMTMK